MHGFEAVLFLVLAIIVGVFQYNAFSDKQGSPLGCFIWVIIVIAITLWQLGVFSHFWEINNFLNLLINQLNEYE